MKLGQTVVFQLTCKKMNTYNDRIPSNFDIRSDGEALDDAIIVDENILSDFEGKEDQATV